MNIKINSGSPQAQPKTYTRAEAIAEGGVFVDAKDPTRFLIVSSPGEAYPFKLYASEKSGTVATLASYKFEAATLIKTTEPFTLTFSN